MIILYEGLLGGACYVNAFYRISEEVSSSYTGSMLHFFFAWFQAIAISLRLCQLFVAIFFKILQWQKSEKNRVELYAS